MIQAVLFDMDGVLFDTERLSAVVMERGIALQGETLTEAQWHAMVGKSLRATMTAIDELFGGRVDGEQFVSDWRRLMLAEVDAHGVPEKPGVRPCLETLRAKGYRLAVVTSNARDVVARYLALSGLDGLFEAVVTGERTARSKPAPDIYLEAARELGVSPEACVGVEDSVNGVQAIRAAGMRCVMIPDVLPYTAALAPFVDLRLETLHELPGAIARWADEEKEQSKMMTVTERFLKYIQMETTSEDGQGKCPSTDSQFALARELVRELQAMGVTDARVDEHCYVYGTISQKGDHPVRLGLIAHMDTSNAVRGATHPQLVKDYDGGAITLQNGVVIDGFDFLPGLKGQDLIVTGGDSVLGADDKAGVAEIMQLAARLTAPDAPEHCTVCLAFTPDEEIGSGADLFDVPGFHADYGYTVDGGALGEIEYENFNAASAVVQLHGVNIHPGSAKDQMKNACLFAMEFNAMLPPAETPAHTEGYEGFYHLGSISGDEELATLRYILRDHDIDKLSQKKATMERIAAFLNDKYGEGTVTLTLKDNYRNMKEMIAPHMEIIERAKAAFTACGVKPLIQPIRGGTDGARLSFMGLPCPNLSTGGYNFHGRKELISVQALEKMVEVLAAIVTNV